MVIDLDIILYIITVESQMGFQWTGLFYIYLKYIVRVEKDFQASGGQIGQMGKDTRLINVIPTNPAMSAIPCTISLLLLDYYM